MKAPRAWLWVAAIAVAGAALGALWRFTPLAAWTDPDLLAAHAAPLRANPLAPVLVVGAYVVAALLVMPVMALVAASALLFGPLRGGAYSLGGIMLSAAITYAVGHWLARDAVRRLASGHVDALHRRLGGRGALAVAALRIVPIAPFTVINVAAGAAAIRLRDFLLGTLFGTLPGIVLISTFADQLQRTLRDADPRNVATLLGLAAGAALVILALRRYARRGV